MHNLFTLVNIHIYGRDNWVSLERSYGIFVVSVKKIINYKM